MNAWSKQRLVVLAIGLVVGTTACADEEQLYCCALGEACVGTDGCTPRSDLCDVAAERSEDKCRAVFELDTRADSCKETALSRCP